MGADLLSSHHVSVQQRSAVEHRYHCHGEDAAQVCCQLLDSICMLCYLSKDRRRRALLAINLLHKPAVA